MLPSIDHRLRASIGLVLVSTLAACGGSSPDDELPTSDNSYHVAAAMATFIGSPVTLQVSGSSTDNGATTTIAGTLTRSQPVAESFEGHAGKSNVITFDLHEAGSGSSGAAHSAQKVYYDNSFNPRGTSLDSSGNSVEYGVVTDISALPAIAHGGESGNWYVLRRYTNSTKTMFLGTTTVTYSFATSDIAANPLLTVTTKVAGPTGAVTVTTTSTYRIPKESSNGSGAAKILKDVNAKPNGSRLELNYS